MNGAPGVGTRRFVNPHLKIEMWGTRHPARTNTGVLHCAQDDGEKQTKTKYRDSGFARMTNRGAVTSWNGRLFFTEDVAHTADLGTDVAELFFEVLVAAVEVVDAVKNGFSVGDEGGEDERGAGAEVGAHDGGGLQFAGAADGGGAALHGDGGSHAVEFLDVHEAVLEDVFGDGGCAVGLRGEGHELGLHVGGEAGELLGGDVGGLERAAAADADVFLADLEADAAGFELGDECAEVGGVAAIDVEVAASDGPGE